MAKDLRYPFDNTKDNFWSMLKSEVFLGSLNHTKAENRRKKISKNNGRTKFEN